MEHAHDVTSMTRTVTATPLHGIGRCSYDSPTFLREPGAQTVRLVAVGSVRVMLGGFASPTS